MPEVKTTRAFQERFLDGYDRSQLRRDVRKVKPQKRLESLKRKYATLALGASLAIGGLGVPMKIHHSMNKSAAADSAAHPDEATNATGEIARDLTAAKSIADQVAGGVTEAASSVGRVVTAPAEAVSAIAQVPVAAATKTAEAMKQQFFQKEIPFGSIIYKEAKKNDLPPELVAAVVHTESKFVPTARSHAGAMGLMQLVPKTGRWMGAKNLMNPVENITAGAKYLRYLTDRFDGDQQKAIAAYNAGEGNVRRFKGVPPFRETRNYISRVRTFQNELGDRLDDHAAQQVAEAR